MVSASRAISGRLTDTPEATFVEAIEGEGDGDQ
jgi:hypothetical protein